MEYLSSDPLNRIIDPVAGSHRPGELPNRKYLLGSVHLDWVVINGRPEIFEISVYVTDMTSLDLYIVTDGLQKHQDTLEHLNFVANPDRHEFYYVQVYYFSKHSGLLLVSFIYKSDSLSYSKTRETETTDREIVSHCLMMNHHHI